MEPAMILLLSSTLGFAAPHMSGPAREGIISTCCGLCAGLEILLPWVASFQTYWMLGVRFIEKMPRAAQWVRLAMLSIIHPLLISASLVDSALPLWIQACLMVGAI
jgi:hypothetical protein